MLKSFLAKYNTIPIFFLWLAKCIGFRWAQIAATSPCLLKGKEKKAAHPNWILHVASRVIKQHHRLRLTKADTILCFVNIYKVSWSFFLLCVFVFRSLVKPNCSESSSISHSKGTVWCTVLKNGSNVAASLPLPWNGYTTLIPAHIVIRRHISDASKRYRLLSVLAIITCKEPKYWR